MCNTKTWNYAAVTKEAEQRINEVSYVEFDGVRIRNRPNMY